MELRGFYMEHLLTNILQILNIFFYSYAVEETEFDNPWIAMAATFYESSKKLFLHITPFKKCHGHIRVQGMRSLP